jgi:hypothetical protein
LVGNLVTAARSSFLNAQDVYGAEGGSAEGKLLATYEALRDPEIKLAQLIQEGASAGIKEVHEFRELNVRLTGRLALMSVAMEQAVVTIQSEILEAGMRPFLSLTGSNDVESTRILMGSLAGDLDKAALRLNFLATRAVLVGYQVDWAFRASADVYSARLGLFSEYTRSLGPTGPRALAGAAINAVATEGKLVVLELTLDALVTALGITFPIALIALPIIRIGIELRRKKFELDATYKRDSSDEALDLLPQLKRENEVTGEVMSMVSQLTDGLMTPLENT